MSRTAAQIRDDLLANLQTEFGAINVRVVTAEKSPWWALASAIALEVEGPEAEAEAARREPFPDTASEEGVLLQAEAAGLTLIGASQATLRVAVTGTPNATLAIGTHKELTSATGLVYLAPDASVTFDGSGDGVTTVTARDAGAAGNLTAGSTLTWQGAPAGFGATATAAAAPGDDSHVLVVGADAETVDVGLRARVASWRKARAQAGTRAEWVDWMLSVKGVGDAYVYPREWFDVTRGVLEPDLPGVLVGVVLAAAPPASSYVQQVDGTLGLGLDPSYRRGPTTTLTTRVRRYIEGTHDAYGVPVPSAIQKQLRSVDVAAANYALLIPSETVVDVAIALDTDPSVAPWPWGIDDPPTRTVASATSTALTLDDATGITAGSRIAVDLGLLVVRGGYWLARVQGVSGNVVTLTQALPAAPSAGATVRPDCGLWSAARARVLGLFDSMGPGDETVAASRRWPRPADHGIDKLYQSQLVALVQPITGVVGANVAAPSTASVSPGVSGLIIPGKIVFEPPP